MSRKKPPVPPAPVKPAETPEVVRTSQAPSMPLPPFTPPVHASEVVIETKEEVLPAEAAAITVIALQNGFFDGQRKYEGDVFTIRSMKELGMWMKLEDAKLEAERQQKRKLAKAGR